MIHFTIIKEIIYHVIEQHVVPSLPIEPLVRPDPEKIKDLDLPPEIIIRHEPTHIN